MNFTNYVTKSIKLRPEFEENLLVVHLPWKEQYDIIIGNPIPAFFTDIYAKCNGNDPDEEKPSYKHFIPDFRLMKIQEVMKLHGEFVKNHSFAERSIIPFLVNDKSEYICYRDVDGVQDIVSLSNGTITPMYDSVDSFWGTLCDCCDQNVYGIDFKQFLTSDIEKEKQIKLKHNPSSM